MYKDLPNEEEQLAHLLFIDEFMKAKGFEHYEFSNFAKPGKQARHNLVYWTGGSYLAFGPSAHSFSQAGAERFKNYSSLHRYADELLKKGELPVEWSRESIERTNRTQKNGCLPCVWTGDSRKLGWCEKLSEKKPRTLLEEGYLEPHPTLAHQLRATARGFSMSDTLIRELA